MITKEQATETFNGFWKNTTFFHEFLKRADKKTPVTARRNGKTKVWKTKPERFLIPIKIGLYEYYTITNENAHEWSVKSS